MIGNDALWPPTHTHTRQSRFEYCVHALHWFSHRRIRIDLSDQSRAVLRDSTGNHIVIREQTYEEMPFLNVLIHRHKDLPNII